MNIETLRAATAEDHRRVESALPLMSPSIDRDTYIECLLGLHGLVAAWECDSLRAAPLCLRELVLGRSRLPLLEADLAWFGVAPRKIDGPAMPVMATVARLLGAMYVMEGSALGGRVIARHLESVLALGPGQGDAYFRGFEERTAVVWREFCEVLQRTVSEEDGTEAALAAREMFGVFEAWMLRPHSSPA